MGCLIFVVLSGGFSFVATVVVVLIIIIMIMGVCALSFELVLLSIFLLAITFIREMSSRLVR